MHSWSTFGVRMSHKQLGTHKTHHGLDLGEATTFPFIVYSTPFHFLPHVPSGKNPGGKPGSIRFHVVPSCLLEPKSQDVQPRPRSCEKLHMGGEGHQRQSKGQMGYPGPPDHQGRARDHRPKDPVRSPPGKVPRQRPRSRRRTLEGPPKAQSGSGPPLGPQPGPQHPGHKLAVRCSQTQKTPYFLVEEYTRRLVEREAGAVQIGTDQHHGSAQATGIREPSHHQPRRQTPGAQRRKRGQRIRQRRLLQSQGPRGLRTASLERPIRPGDELPPRQQVE